MRKNISITNAFLLYIVVSFVLCTGIIGCLWISHLYAKFHEDTEVLRQDYLKSQKNIIKKEVEAVIDYINYKKSMIREQLNQEIKRRTYEAAAIAKNIYDENKAIRNDSEIKKMVKDALRPIRFDDGQGYYFAGNMKGIEELFPDKPELEGTDLSAQQD
ncbi:MAG: cache domain-containing protein, partial [Deltaproteobacteria bacterium]|nr:cache domain-containing protein [Deltaproteobacteria bacterium]